MDLLKYSSHAALLSVLCLSGQPAAVPEVTLKVEPLSISAGQRVHISWRVSGATRVFLSDSGIVGASGERDTRPENSTTYVLVAENKDGAVVRTARVEVEAGKGDDPFPPERDFTTRFPHYIDAPSLPDALNAIEFELVKHQRMTLDSHEERDGSLVYETARHPRADIQSERRGVGRWRAAFRIVLRPPAKTTKRFDITIQPLIEYQLKREAIYRRESDPVLNETHARVLADSINAHPQQKAQP